MKLYRLTYSTLALLSLSLTSIDFTGGCGGINLFSIEDDKNLGSQVDQEIQADPANYPILDESQYPEAYAYLRGIRDQILNSGKVAHRDDFEWQVRIVRDDNVLNAFATPGGYLYFYTGLIKFLDIEDQFSGVAGHEIAHAAERHTTEALTEQYGIELLLQAALGNNLEIVQEIAQGLAGLSFSRGDESEADEFSVIYLSMTQYQCNGAAGFFEKLIEEGSADSPPEFLSTHPSPVNRIEAIHQKSEELGCDTTPSGRDYQSFKNLLP